MFLVVRLFSQVTRCHLLMKSLHYSHVFTLSV